MFCAAKAHPYYLSLSFFFGGGGGMYCVLFQNFMHWTAIGPEVNNKPGKRKLLVGDGLLTQ
jgi:hypothetical protein